MATKFFIIITPEVNIMDAVKNDFISKSGADLSQLNGLGDVWGVVTKDHRWVIRLFNEIGFIFSVNVVSSHLGKSLARERILSSVLLIQSDHFKEFKKICDSARIIVYSHDYSEQPLTG